MFLLCKNQYFAYLLFIVAELQSLPEESYFHKLKAKKESREQDSFGETFAFVDSDIETTNTAKDVEGAFSFI